MVNAPFGWKDTSPSRFVNEPYSPDALAEPIKSVIDLGPINMSACTDATSGTIKEPGRTEVSALHASGELLRAHNLFLDAARIILGDEIYENAAVEFTHRIGADAQVRDRPHLDGEFRRPAERRLKLIGMASTAPTTTLLQGALRPDLLADDGRLISLRNLYSRFRQEPIPEERIIIVGPAMLHSPASGDRQFMRWHVKV